MAFLKKGSKKVKNTKACEIDGIKFKSTLEANVYTVFKEFGIPLDYEKETYTILQNFEYQGENVRPIRITPDFEAVNMPVIIEAKGHPNEAFPLRLKLFKKYLSEHKPHHSLYIIRSKKQAMELASKLQVYSKPTALFDGDGICYIAGLPKNGILRPLEEVFEYVDAILSDGVKKTNCEAYIGYLTGSNNFRKDINPEYKANRKGKEKPPYFKEIREYLINKHNFQEFKGLEADDCISIIAKHYKNTVIVSVDKDLNMLEGTVYNPRKQLIAVNTKEDFDKYFWTSMIVGDTADNVKGIPGYGPKKAEIILSDTSKPYHTLVLNAYVEAFKEDGVSEFCKNYYCLKLLDKYKGFIIPESNESNLNVTTASEVEIG